MTREIVWTGMSPDEWLMWNPQPPVEWMDAMNSEESNR